MDGSSLIVTTNESPAVHVWDLFRIRKKLASLGLDWHAAAYASDEPASATFAALPPLHVDLGTLAAHAEYYSEPAEAQVKRHTARLAVSHDDFEAYHDRGHAYHQLGRREEAVDDFTQAIRLRPNDTHLRIMRAEIYELIGRLESAIADLEVALACSPTDSAIRELLARLCHRRNIYVVAGQESPPDTERKLMLARRAVELAPHLPIYLYSLGLTHYSACQYAESVAILEQSLALHPGWYDGRSFFFLAVAYHRLGNRARAREYFDRGVRALAEEDSRADPHPRPLAAFRASAARILAGPAGELPADVFAPRR